MAAQHSRDALRCPGLQRDLGFVHNRTREGSVAKSNKERSRTSHHKQFVGEGQAAKPANGAAAPRDILQHDESMAREVEEHVREVADKTLAAAEDPAKAAERLVQAAESELLHKEVEHATELREQHKRIEVLKHPIDTLRSKGFELADSLAKKAEKRLDGLPAPVKRAVQTAEKAAALALTPVRFGLRLAGDILRTPLALARILFRHREA
jgi:hypothetical protein